MWNLKKQIWPKKRQSSFSAKLNHQGKLVTSPGDLKKLLSKEYNERLRVRPDHPEMENIFKTKKVAFEAKIREARLNKSADWKMTDLEEVLKNIKKNKSRDPGGLNRSIFHTNCIGNDHKQASQEGASGMCSTKRQTHPSIL